MGFFRGATLSGLLSGATAALTANGVTGATQTSVLQQLGSVFSTALTSTNPNEAQELVTASQIITFAGNPTVDIELDESLLRMAGLPAAAQAICVKIASKLGTPGYDPTAECLQIEQIIRAGG